MGKASQRESSTELLRIISMIMIMGLHSFSVEAMTTTTNVPVEFFRESMAICSVNVFVLISGFYSIKWKTKSFFLFIFQIYFYSLIIYILALCLGITEFEKSQFFSRIIYPFGNWWFVESYLLLYIVSPFLNKIYQNSSIWVTAVLIVFLYGTIAFGLNFKNILLFSVIYMIGRIMNTYKCLFQKINRNSYLIIFLLLTVIITFLTIVYFKNGAYSNKMLQHYIWGFNYKNPLVILQAISLFLYVTSYSYYNKAINKVAVSAFAVYLIHMHPDVKDMYYNFAKELYHFNDYTHYFIMMIFIAFVFMFCVLIDQVRLYSFSKINCFVKK